MRLSGEIFSMGPDKPAMLGPGRRQGQLAAEYRSERRALTRWHQVEHSYETFARQTPAKHDQIHDLEEGRLDPKGSMMSIS
jgi:hypothetical protein